MSQKMSSRSSLATIAIVVLAAGRSARMHMGSSHKLLALFDGVPLARRVTLRATESMAHQVIVVIGHRADDIERSLSGIKASIIRNVEYLGGMSTSIAAGLQHPSVKAADGIMIVLADMPNVTTEHLNLLISEFWRMEANAIVRATANGEAGNPVIFPRSTYGQLLKLSGDKGARALIRELGLEIRDVEIGAAASIDVDNQGDLADAGGIPENMHLTTVSTR